MAVPCGQAHAGRAPDPGFEGWTLDAARRELTAPGGGTVDIAGAEYDMLLAFLEHPQRVLSRATMRNICQNLVFAYNVIGIPVAASVLYSAFGILLRPVVAALAMSLSSVSVIGNALRLRSVRV